MIAETLNFLFRPQLPLQPQQLPPLQLLQQLLLQPPPPRLVKRLRSL